MSRLLGLVALLCAACATAQPSYVARDGVLALPGWVLYQGASGPLSVQPEARVLRVAPERVHGSACQRGVQLPLLRAYVPDHSPHRAAAVWLSVGWGKGAYEQVLGELARGLPAGAVLTDVEIDLRERAILSVYREQCLEVSAAVLLREG